MKKRFITAVFSTMLIMSTLVLASCGGGGSSDSPFVGTWECTKIEVNGTELTLEDIGLPYFTVEIKDDGTLHADNGEYNVGGKWKDDGDGIKITDDTQNNITGTIDGEQLHLDYTGSGVVYVMEKSNLVGGLQQ